MSAVPPIPARSSFSLAVRASSRFLLACGTLLLAGCGDDWQAETYSATGTVSINGKPAVDAVVELRSTGQQPDSRNSRPWGVVQADGTYQLTTYVKGDGAPPGDYAVTLRWPSDLSSPSHFDRLSGKYDEPEAAPLDVSIAAEENALPPIELSNVTVLPVDARPNNSRRTPGPGPRPRR